VNAREGVVERGSTSGEKKVNDYDPNPEHEVEVPRSVGAKYTVMDALTSPCQALRGTELMNVVGRWRARE
jgi:hypothetical protein